MENLRLIEDMYRKVRKQTGFMKHYYTLASIVEGLEAKNTFEFGTGISTMLIVDAVKAYDGKHTSCDIRNLVDTGVPPAYYVENANHWTYLQKNSNSLKVEDFNNMGPFDFVLHDGSHIPGEVAKDLQKIVPVMKQNSILMVHDTWTDNFKGMHQAVIRATSGIFCEAITLPFSNGLTIMRITQDFGHGTVTPTWSKND
jgi:predicted O-methyltransferase YrrM